MNNENQPIIIRFKVGDKKQVEHLKEYNRLRALGYTGTYVVNQQNKVVTITLTAPQKAEVK